MSEPLPCPICESEMDVKPYASGKGFRYVCRGEGGEPHKVTVYVELHKQRGVGRPRKESDVSSRADRLMERLSAL